MSRIGNRIITVPAGVTVEENDAKRYYYETRRY